MLNALTNEEAVAGAILLDESCLPAVTAILTETDFAYERPRAIFKAAVTLSATNEPIDPITISEKMRANGFVADTEYLMRLISSTPTAANVEAYAVLVKADSRRRSLRGIADEIAGRLDSGIEPDEVTSDVFSMLDDMERSTPNGLVSGSTAIQEFFSYRAELERTGAKTIVRTGYQNLDNILGGGLVNGGLYVIGARPGQGKAQPLDAKVLTINGYKNMADIALGDKVATETGEFADVVGIFPQGKKDVYRVSFSDGGSCECTDEHLWTVQNRRDRLNGTSRTVELKDMMETIKINADHRLNWSVQYASPTQFPKRELLLDPYLMGMLLGDGGFTGSGVMWTNTEADMIQRFKEKLPEQDEAVPTDISWRVRRKQRNNEPSEVKKALTHYGLIGKLANEKHIPVDYLLSDVEDRLDLLRGLCDTDGSVVCNGTPGQIEYSTTSKQLAEDIKFLTQSLGGRCKVRSRMGAYIKDGVKKHTQRNYRVLIHMPTELPPVTSEKHLSKYIGVRQRNVRYISGIEYVGEKECQCIKVNTEAGLYVTNDYIVTHNTSLAMCLLDNIASTGMPTLFVSLEMTRLELTAKRLSRESGVTYNTVLMRLMGDAEYKAVNEASSRLYSLPVTITDKPHMTVNDIALAARRVKGLKCMCIDYFGLISPNSRKSSRYEQMTEIIDDLKRLAKTLNIPILCLAQLNRENENRADHRPKLSDLRETGAVEQSADAVIFVHREQYYDTAAEQSDSELMELIVAKNRHGRVGTANMMWFGATGRVYAQHNG